MLRTSGNNAYKLNPEAVVITRRADDLASLNRKRIDAENRIHARSNNRRIARTLLDITVIGIVALLFAGVLVRGANILKLHYSNVALENEIRQLITDTENVKEDFVNTADPNLIRTIAINELGMREPAQSQVISIIIPAADKVTLSASAAAGTSGNTDFDGLFDNLEGFFKTIR